MGGIMETKLGRSSIHRWVWVCLLSAITSGSIAVGQTPAPVQPTPTPTPIIATETPNGSMVFPDGGFPSTPSAPEGGIPATGTPEGKPQITLPPATGSNPPSGYPRDFDYQDGPRVDPYGGTDLYRTMLLEAESDRFGVAPRFVSDYTLPGFEARDQQVGPGVAEFTPIPPPTPVTPEERLRYVVRGIVPGSFLAPGTNTSFRMRGFVRLTSMYDFNSIGSADSFVPRTIPAPQQPGENWNMTARPSRIAFESWTPTSVFDWNVHTFLEGDFFNGADQAAGGGGNPFRLRHAFVDFGYFRVGQQNTVFMDASTWPLLVDFQGPAGWVNQRRPSMRMTVPLADKLFWAGGIEGPFSDITTNGLGQNVQDVPDFATHLRYESDLGHAQIAGLMRTIGYRPTDGEVTRRMGYGMSVGTAFHPWAALMGTNPVRKANPSGLERSRIIGQYTFGWGIGRYLQDTVGQGFDGQVDPNTGGFDVLFASGFVISYEHWFTEKWLSQVTYSGVQVASNQGQPGTTFAGSKYLAATVWYVPVRNVSIGAEYIFGQRKNLNEQRGDASRMQLMFQYNF